MTQLCWFVVQTVSSRVRCEHKLPALVRYVPIVAQLETNEGAAASEFGNDGRRRAAFFTRCQSIFRQQTR
jgi:hypothetical protein